MDQNRERGAKKVSWGKRIVIALGVLAVLAVAFYFVATSGAFIKAVILPRVGAAINGKVTAGHISLSPFSSVEIQKLRVETTGDEPLLTADEVRVRYSLMDILRGNYNIHELTVTSPVINIVTEPDGSSNLDPVLEGEEEPASEEPLKLNIRDLSLKNGVVRQITKSADGVSRTEVQGINVTIDQLGNGQSGKVALAADFTVDQRHGATNDLLAGNISGGYDLALTQDLLPETIKGATRLTIGRAQGAFEDLAGFSSSLEADLTPTEIREVALKFNRNDQQLGQVRLRGPMNMEQKEGNLQFEILSLDKQLLSLLTAGQNLDFRNTTIGSTNQLAISQNGTFFAASGRLAGNRISVSQESLTTPEMDLNVTYQLSVNTREQTALLQELNIAGASGGQEFLRTRLDQQMNLSWGETVKGYKDAALRIVLTNFNLGDWRPLIGTNLVAGILNANVGIVSQQDGRLLNTEINAGITGLTAQIETNRIENASLNFQSTGTVQDLKIVNIPRYTLALQQNNQPVIQANGAARLALESNEMTAQISAEGALPRLLEFAKIPDISATAGTLKLSANVSDSAGKQIVTGQLGIEGFHGSYAPYSFTNYQLGFEYNVEADKSGQVEIRRAAVTFAQGFNSGGSVELRGRYHLEKEDGQLSFKTVDINQNALAPILAPSLGENRLISISLTAAGEAKLDPAGESTITADIKVGNWVVHDPAGKLPRTPLSAELKLDGGMRGETLDLRQLLVQLSPTPRADNRLQLQAKLDLSTNNPAPSTLSLRSESFDVTPYYDMFASAPTNETVASTPGSAPSGPASTPADEQEPEPIDLPFKQMTADLKIDRLFLREIAITNWVGTVTIRSNVVQLNPFDLLLNGGPVAVRGTFDVGRPGYQYNLGFKADNVPLAPIANTLELANSNQLKGIFIADTEIQGAGITGPNLRRNLGGRVNFSLTNLNYEVGGPKLRRILVPMSVALRAPELAQTPINWVQAQAVISNGIAQVTTAAVESEAFFANVTGTVTLANQLTNSALNLPITLSLRRSLAEKARILPSGTPDEARYASLGQIYSIRGTLGAPEPDANKTALAGLAIQSAAGFGLGDEKTGQALGALGNILTGQSSTNAPGNTNASPAANLLQGLGGLLGGGQPRDTNAPAGTISTNQPAPASPLENLLRGLPRQRQE